MGIAPFNPRQLPWLLAGTLALQGCPFLASPAVPDTSIKVGLVSSYSGANSGAGARMEDALNMALTQINATGGVLGGRKLALLTADDASDPATAAKVANDLIARGVVALIGPNSSGNAKQVALLAAKVHGVPMISSTASSPDFSDPTLIDSGGFFFRTCPSDALQGKALAIKAEALGYKKLVVLHTDNSYGLGLSGVLDKAFTGTVLDLAYPYTADPQQQSAYDYATLVGKALDAKPDAVALIGYASDASLIMNQWIRDGRLPALHWLFTDSTDAQDFVDNVSDKTRMENQIGTRPYSDPTFLTRFRALYPNDGGISGAAAYDAMVLVALAIASANDTTPADIQTHLRLIAGPTGEAIGPDDLAKGLTDAAAGKTITYTGWSGPFNFNAQGDMATGKYGVWTVKGGLLQVTDEVLSP